MKLFKTNFYVSGSVGEDSDVSLFPIELHVGKLNERDVAAVSAYMRSFPILMEWVSTREDPLNSKAECISSSRTDGVYVWEDLHTYLVETYALGLPQDFIDHVYLHGGERNNYEAKDDNLPSLVNDRLSGEAGKVAKIAQKLGLKDGMYSFTDRADLILDFDEILSKYRDVAGGNNL